MRLLFIIFIIFSQSIGAAAYCSSDTFDRVADVKRVIDGDTIELTSGEMIRLIGIDAPELNYEHFNLSEPYALSAKSRLIKLIGDDNFVKLLFDNERTDTYGRTLAHVFNHQNTNVQAELLKSGLVRQMVIQPNLAFWPCYQRYEVRARKSLINAWRDEWQPTLVDHNLHITEDFNEYVGKISDFTQSSSTSTFVLNKLLYVKGVNKETQFLIADKLLKGQEVVVKGRLYREHNKWFINLKHASQLIPLRLPR